MRHHHLRALDGHYVWNRSCWRCGGHRKLRTVCSRGSRNSLFFVRVATLSHKSHNASHNARLVFRGGFHCVGQNAGRCVGRGAGSRASRYVGHNASHYATPCVSHNASQSHNSSRCASHNSSYTANHMQVTMHVAMHDQSQVTMQVTMRATSHHANMPLAFPTSYFWHG